MQRPKRWNFAAETPSEGALRLADCLKTSPLIAQMLINRGVSEIDDCRGFLSPSLKGLHDPALIPNLPKAAERIARAIRDREKVVIYGDYDVDGITATSILWHAIRTLGGEVDYYIPHRIEEGYGLNADAIRSICEAGAKLIITVDCGVTAIEEAKVARERGVDLIITDHHEGREHRDEAGGMRDDGHGGDHSSVILPDCFAVVHPRLPVPGAPAYPNPVLCGAGVAFKLAWGVGQAHGGAVRVSETFRKFLVEATGLAALGTIADVVPLTGENRLLAHFGLSGLRQSQLIGIRALIESAHLTGQKLDSYDVGFKLAPRLNACGRMGHAREAVEMLTRADEGKAIQIATYLEEQNRKRQSVERKIADEAMEQATRLGFDSDDCRGVVLASEEWHSGVIGIVASRVVGKLNKPTVMIALSNGHGQGSARSVPGFHLARALDACREHLEACGGHEMAAGLRLETSKFADFRQAFCEYAKKGVSDEMMTPTIRVDCVAELRQLSEALVTDLHRLGPFGPSNPKPLLCCSGVEIAGEPRTCGRNSEHLQFRIRQGNTLMKCIAFGRAELANTLQSGVRVDIAGEPGVNEFNGHRSVELEVKDVRLTQGA